MVEDIMERSSVVYKITNRINNKAYVGLTVRALGQRIKEHMVSDYPIGEAIRKYGWENFDVEILATGNTVEELCLLERYFIAKFKTNDPDFGYNLTEGGEHITGWHHTDQTKKNISIALTGRVFTEEHKENLRQANLGEKNPMYGKHLTDEQKEALRVALSGPNNPLYGIPRPEEVKAKISATKQANGPNEEVIAKAKEASSIPVFCDQTGMIYASITEVAEAIGVSRTAVSLVCHGKQKDVKGFTFQFVDPDRAQVICDRLNENRGLVNNTAVVCIDTGEIFESMIAAAESIGLDPSNISSVCCGRSRTAGGKRWRRLTDEELDYTDRRCRAVICTDTGVIYESVVEAAKILGLNPSSIYSVCYGKAKAVNGLHFKYVEAESKRNISEETKRNQALALSIRVLCIDTGEEYDSIAAAAAATGIEASNIGAACLGKRKTAGGKRWRRLDRPYEEADRAGDQVELDKSALHHDRRRLQLDKGSRREYGRRYVEHQ